MATPRFSKARMVLVGRCCLPALMLLAGCRNADPYEQPAPSARWNVPPPLDALQGDLMGVDPRARQIERNLGLQ